MAASLGVMWHQTRHHCQKRGDDARLGHQSSGGRGWRAARRLRCEVAKAACASTYLLLRAAALPPTMERRGSNNGAGVSRQSIMAARCKRHQQNNDVAAWRRGNGISTLRLW
jgi:hypothetical protein